jgi:gluconolactonase
MKNTTFVVSLFLSCGLAIAQESKPAEAPKPAAAPAAATPAPATPAAPVGKPLDYFETTELTTVSTGHMWSEGPLWWNGKLLFCDLADNKISTIAPGDAKAAVLKDNADKPAGAAVDGQGNLIIAHFSGGKANGEKTTGGKVTKLAADGTMTTILDSIDDKPVGPCNDFAVRADGTIYVTDFGGGKDNRNIIKIAPDGKATVVPSNFQQANGLALSPDETVLYVAEYRGQALKAFDVTADGSLSNERVFVDFKSDGNGRCDGLKVDEQGNVYTTGPGGIWVISPKGEKLARLDVKSAANLAFGGEDRKTLFICAGSKVLSVKTKIAGAARKAAKPATTTDKK